VPDEDQDRLEELFQRWEKRLPQSAGHASAWLRRPSSRWARIPAAVLLMIGGLLSFLPVLGLWMFPLGLLLLAIDLPFLRRPVGKSLVWLEQKITRWFPGR